MSIRTYHCRISHIVNIFWYMRAYFTKNSPQNYYLDTSCVVQQNALQRPRKPFHKIYTLTSRKSNILQTILYYIQV